MMPRKLYIKQKVMTIPGRDEFQVKDQDGKTMYTVKNKYFSLHDKVKVYDMQENIVAELSKALLEFRRVFNIDIYDRPFATIRERVGVLHSKYDVCLQNDMLKVRGSFFGHNFEITRNDSAVGKVHKSHFSWSDSYEVTMNEHNLELELLMICLVLALDVVSSDQEDEKHDD